ncbi:anthranilate synthase component 1 [Vibrio ulleungensis]|uniref:Anthranilate synthase component 1 n=1 Tax=Vibrio ulleungensis TaxID=2807619 RepID=A0ABS2HLT5_9VIBR|nr:anthranilate synthase component 1 [Vibrio ulleungensis]MBM7038455.1 anthranilate synthase component 1 [Vibrio ulleungensis]
MSSAPYFDVIKQDLPYFEDPTQLFNSLCHDKSCSLLLESAEIDSKQNLKSLLLVDAALRIECFGHQVRFEILTPNGQAAIKAVLPLFEQSIIEYTEYHLLVELPHTQNHLDEDSRLKQQSIFDALRSFQTVYGEKATQELDLFVGGLFAYDVVANFEPLGDAKQVNQCPDYVFYLAEKLVVIDHQKQQCVIQGSVFASSYADTLKQDIVALTEVCKQLEPLPKPIEVKGAQVSTNISDQAFCDIVTDLKRYVVSGDIFQVVPSRKFTLPCPSPLAAYKELKRSNPSPYMFYMQDKEFTLFGASPESALKYCRDSNQIEIYPIAGTRRRGKNSDGTINFDLDSRIELELRSDKKENAEHMMLVDLARNDVARIAEPGSRYVADLLQVDRYSHVMHLVSRVVGQLRHDLDALHAYQACMNMGTLTGAPKIRAMQLIRQVEKERRGSYGGAVGYLTGRGDLDTCIVIRSAYVEDGVAQVQAGAGVVFDSDPQSEAEETTGKAQAVVSAIAAAHNY